MKNIFINNRALLIELLSLIKITIKILLFLGIDFDELNFIDTNKIFIKIQSFIDYFNNLDDESKFILLSIIMIAICLFYVIYMFFFMISPALFNTIKDILPIKIKNFMVKFININRIISVPFVILSFICIIIGLSCTILNLSILFIFKS